MLRRHPLCFGTMQMVRLKGQSGMAETGHAEQDLDMGHAVQEVDGVGDDLSTPMLRMTSIKSADLGWGI